MKPYNFQTRNLFLAYFNDGLTASEATHLHESKLLLQEESCNLLANSAINPTKRQVNYLHDEWRKQLQEINVLNQSFFQGLKEDLMTYYNENTQNFPDVENMDVFLLYGKSA